MYKTFPNWKQKPVVVSKAPDPTLKTMFDEALRRDNIIKGLVAKLKCNIGGLVKPVKPEDLESYGTCRVTAICDSYGKYGKNEEWPANDNPFLLGLFSEKKNEYFWCTTNWIAEYK